MLWEWEQAGWVVRSLIIMGDEGLAQRCVFAYRRLIKLFSLLLKVNATNQDPELFLILHLFMC